MTAINAEERTREALEWALEHTCLAIPPGCRTAAFWQWNGDDVQLQATTADGDFRFHVAAERRRGVKTRIAILSWEDDQGTATWEAEMPNEGRRAARAALEAVMPGGNQNGPDWEGFGRAVMADWPECGDIDGFTLQDMAVEHGLLREVPGGFNPEEHIDVTCCAEPGDVWFEVTFPSNRGRLAHRAALEAVMPEGDKRLWPNLDVANAIRGVVDEALARYDVPSDAYEQDILIDAACVRLADKLAAPPPEPDELERLRAENERLRAELADGSFYKESDIDALQDRAKTAEQALAEAREALQGLVNALEIEPGPRGVMDLVPSALARARAALAEGGRDE